MAKKNTINHGIEALELAQTLSSRVNRIKEISESILNIHKYRWLINSSTTISLPKFMGQRNTPLHLIAKYGLSSSITGSIKVFLNDKQIRTVPINGEVNISMLMEEENVIKFTFSTSAEIYFTNISIVLSGKFQLPGLTHDLIVFTTSGVDLYQLSTNREMCRYNFLNTEDMLNDYENLEYIEQQNKLWDHCCTYSSSGGSYYKSGDFILYGTTLAVKDMVTSQVYNSGIECSDVACICPRFSVGKAIIYYIHEDVLYYTMMDNTFSFSTPVVMNQSSKYVINKLVSFKSADDAVSYNPHFVFINNNSDAYITACSGPGLYGSPQKLGKAEHVQAYANGSNLTIFLSYAGSVTKITGTVSSLDGITYFLSDTKETILNADVGFMSGTGDIYYKMQNCICEE